MIFTRCRLDLPDTCALYQIDVSGGGLTAITNFDLGISDLDGKYSASGSLAFIGVPDVESTVRFISVTLRQVQVVSRRRSYGRNRRTGHLMGRNSHSPHIAVIRKTERAGRSLTDQVEILRRREVLFVNGQSIPGPSSGCSLDVRPDGSIE